MPISEENDPLKMEPSSTMEDDNEIDPKKNLYISSRPDIHFRKEHTDLYYKSLSIDNDDLISFAYQIASGMVSHDIISMYTLKYYRKSNYLILF